MQNKTKRKICDSPGLFLGSYMTGKHYCGHLVTAARKCRGVLALNLPLPRCADGCTTCKPRLVVQCVESRCTSPADMPSAVVGVQEPAAQAQLIRQWTAIWTCGQSTPGFCMIFQLTVFMDMLSVYASADLSSQARARPC